MDIAQLGYEVDSSGLERGTRALEDNAKAAEKVADAAAGVEDRLARVAREGVAYAESMRGANISERALAEAAREAAAGVDVKAQVMARAGTEQERMAARAEQLRQAEERLKRETEQAARATKVQELNLQALLGKIDPTIGKLNQLAQMEGTLEKALDLGAITPEVFDHYQGKIDQTRAAILKAGQANDIMERSLGGLNLRAVETQQSLASLVRAVATGQWGQAQSSMTSLTARTGLMGGAFSAAGLMVGGATVAVGAFTVMAARGYVESRRIEGAIVALGNGAGVTTGQMLNLRNEIGSATRDYAGANQVIQQLLQSGKLTGDMLESVARTAGNIARTTGQSITTVASDIESMATSGQDAVARLNEKYGFLTLATYRQIEAIRAERGDVAALTAALIELEQEQARRADGMASSAGLIERAWNGAKGAVLDTLQAIKDVGRTDLEHQFRQAARQMENMRMGAGLSDPDSYGPYVQARKEVGRLLGDLMELDAKEEERARKRKRDNAMVAAEAEAARQRDGASDSINRRLEGLDRESAKLAARNRIIEEYNRLAEDDPRHFDGSMQRLIEDAEKRIDQQFTKRTAARKAQVSEEDRAAKRLAEQYAQTEAGLARQIALHGQVGRAAAMAYDTAHGALQGYSATQKSALMEMSQWLDWLDEMDALQGVWDDVAADHRKAMGENQRQTDAMTEYASQAARNMQSHFADFLFDPFADGTRSMGEQFSQTLRRMVAEAASAKFFEMIGGAMSQYAGAGAGWINAIGGAFQGQGKAGREYGGHVTRNSGVRVGERNKPELLSTPSGQWLIPGEDGRVDPIRAVPTGRGGAMGTPQININVTGGQVERATARQNDSGGFDLDLILRELKGTLADDFASGGMIAQAGKMRYDWQERL